MLIVSCQQCEEKFYAKPSWIRYGSGKFCSPRCQHEAQKNGRLFPCHICKKQIYRSKNDQRKCKSGKFFCSKSCQTRWRNTYYVGEKHGNWTNGMASYRSILLKSGAPVACAKCKSLDKRILAVHHKDRNRKNNAVSNLTWLCHNCHFLVHHYHGEATGFLVPVA